MSKELTLGEAIAIDRKKRDITQAQLSRALKVPATTIHRWEIEGAVPRPYRLIDLMSYFGDGSATHEVASQMIEDIESTSTLYVEPKRRRQSANTAMHKTLEAVGASYVDLRTEFSKQYLQELALYDPDVEESDDQNVKRTKADVVHLYRQYEDLTRELSRKLAHLAVVEGDDII